MPGRPPVLVLLNGLPASGKSTLARDWCARRAAELPVALDVDLLRAMVVGWRDSPVPAGLAARAMALAAARAHLESGRDVVVPQFLRRAPFADELAATAEAAGARFLECVLAIPHEVALARFTARAADGGADEGRLEEPMHRIREAFDAFVATRPGAVRLDALDPGLPARLDAAVERARAT